MIDMNLWNKRDLPQPPINTYKTINKDVDIQHMSNVFKEAKSVIDNNKYFVTEHAILARIIYRMKMKFRSSKDFKTIEKLKKALDRLFEINLSTDLQNFIDLIPIRYRTETYLPTKNLLDYILIRMQGMVKLHERIVETAKTAVPLLEDRLNIGHFWQLAFILYAVVSRIYVLAKHSANHICESYNKIRPFSKKLENTSKNLVPDHESLPLDLKEWLNVDWLDLDDDVRIIEEVSRLPDILDFFNLIDDDEDVEFCDEYFLLDSDSDDNKNDDKSNKRNHGSYSQLDGPDEDIEIIDAINETEKKLDKIMTSKSKKTENNLFRGFEDEDKGEIIEINDVSLIDNTQKQSEGQVDNIENKSSIISISDVNSNESEEEGDTPEDGSVICISQSEEKFSEKHSDNDLAISGADLDQIPKKKNKKKLKNHVKVTKNTTKTKQDFHKKLKTKHTTRNIDGLVPENDKNSEKRKFKSAQNGQNALYKNFKRKIEKAVSKNQGSSDEVGILSEALEVKSNKKRKKKKRYLLNVDQSTVNQHPIANIPKLAMTEKPSRKIAENTPNTSHSQKSGKEVTNLLAPGSKNINKKNKNIKKKNRDINKKNKVKQKLLTECQNMATERPASGTPRSEKVERLSRDISCDVKSEQNVPISNKTAQVPRTTALKRIARRKAKSAHKQNKLQQSNYNSSKSKLSQSQMKKIKKMLKKKQSKPYSFKKTNM